MVLIASDEIERYAEAHTTQPSELLLRLAEETRADLRSPTMMSGPVAGRLLELLVFALRPERVLELGTYSGYSSISMASALPPGGHIDTCELDETHAAVARRYLDEAGLGDRVTIHLGPALETIARLEGEFDLIFVDADKVATRRTTRRSCRGSPRAGSWCSTTRSGRAAWPSPTTRRRRGCSSS